MTLPASNRDAAALNRECLCTTLNPAALESELTAAHGNHELYRLIRDTRPQLFSATAVFVSPQQVKRMQDVIAAVEAVVATPAWRAAALRQAPASAARDPRCPGVFFGYDFHLGDQGPRLIEINTNAGGALLNVYLGRAQQAGCPDKPGHTAGPVALATLEDEFVAMFRNEWRLARGSQPLTRIAIVDDAPATQYLYPEFILFQALFQRHGIEALIADPADLEIRDGRLAHAQGPVDLVYNRTTDFYFEQPAHAVLRESWLDDLALITPHPRAHALYADKRNLISLTDPEWLRTAGMAPAGIDTLMTGIARTRLVERARAETLWSERKRLFFKPASGYGSKAVYRGDKLTRRVWEEILAGAYVAQELVPPGKRQVQVDSASTAMKYDMRCFVYAGRIQLLAARLYQGQTTNFRTPGGGFAPILYPPTGATA